jgi:Gpi18-like mannosyltransferase
MLDMWGRWDTGWYISIIERGYSTSVNQFGQGNTAFFPLYPYLVELVHDCIVPGSLQTRGTILLIGVLVSNLAFLGALTLLYLLVRRWWTESNVAQKAVLYLCIFPTAFVFSAFYTESLFLLLSVAAFYLAEKERWWLAGLAGGLAALTRATGVLCAIPLGILYWQQKRRFEWNVVSLGIIPLALLGLGIALCIVTGDPLELFNSHAGWNHEADWPWRAFFSLSSSHPMQVLDKGMIVLFTALSLATLKKKPAYGVWAILNTVFLLAIKGNPNNMTRYVSVAFPALFMLAAYGEEHRRLHQAIVVASAMMLSLLMALWSRYYKVV